MQSENCENSNPKFTEFDEPYDILTYIKNIRNNFLNEFELLSLSNPIYEKLNWLNLKVKALEKIISIKE